MSTDMTVDVFVKQPYGKIALEKFGNVSENFRIYHVEWLDRTIMAVTGAEFRKVKKGPNKGKLSIKIKGTNRTVYVTADEINMCEEGQK